MVSTLPVEVEEKTTRGHNYKLKKKRCYRRRGRVRRGVGHLAHV